VRLYEIVMSALRRTDPWLAPVALMSVIFFFSAQPHLSSGLGWVDHVGRKLIHAGEYGLLCFLWWRALRTVARFRRALVTAWSIAAAYAVSDEIHQRFVAGRHSSWVDVTIDWLGAAVAATLVVRAQRNPIGMR
jgi:VanZ family protein